MANSEYSLLKNNNLGEVNTIDLFNIQPFIDDVTTIKNNINMIYRIWIKIKTITSVIDWFSKTGDELPKFVFNVTRDWSQ